MEKDWSSPYSKDKTGTRQVFIDGFWIPIKHKEKYIGDLPPSTVVGYDLTFDKHLFNQHPADYIKKRSDTESPKFNIKIKKRDLLIIDEIAKDRGNTRAEVINYLLYQHLLSELKSVCDTGDEKDNKKLQMLLAARADAITHKTTYPDAYDDLYFDPMGWCGDLLGDVLEKVFSDYYEYGEMKASSLEANNKTEPSSQNTETYKKIYEKLIENEVEEEDDE